MDFNIVVRDLKNIRKTYEEDLKRYKTFFKSDTFKNSTTGDAKEVIEKIENVYDMLFEEFDEAIDLLSKDNGEISDGYHTFNELYHHRMMLFAVICNNNKGLSWKSWKHHDGTMFEDYFIVGVTTVQGQYTYHYHKDNWDMFDCKELDNAPEWDGHQPSDIDRLLSL